MHLMQIRDQWIILSNVTCINACNEVFPDLCLGKGHNKREHTPPAMHMQGVYFLQLYLVYKILL